MRSSSPPPGSGWMRLRRTESHPRVGRPALHRAVDRSSAACELSGIAVPNAVRDTTIRRKLERNVPAEVRLSMAIPANQPLARPYWLEARRSGDGIRSETSGLIGMPETPPPFYARVKLAFGEQQLSIDVPVRYRWVDPTRGEQYRTLFGPSPGLGLTSGSRHRSVRTARRGS